MLKKWICAGAILMAVGTGGMTAQAADAGSINQADYKKALETAPMGIVMDGEDAAVTTEKTDSQNRSKAEIVSGNNPSVPNGQVVSMTRHQSEYASIWSKHGSEFELTKPQTTSMWLYFGNQYSASGEGMAFAIHNDARGVNAMPELNKKGSVPGETLGVWPSDTVRTQGEAAGLAKRGIQNSWALEFDTHQNIKSGGACSRSSGLV